MSGYLESHRRQLVLGVCCVSILLVGIDMTAVNVAIPSIGREFHTSASNLSWIIDAYALVLATLLMLSSSMADRFGRKRIFRIGLGTFVLGSALCAVAPNLGWLIAFRALQGIGGSMLNPVAMAVIANVFPERAERARAIGVWAGVTGVSLAIGPIVGGALVGSSLGWRWIFLINVPIGLAAVASVRRSCPSQRPPRLGRSTWAAGVDRHTARQPRLRRDRGPTPRLGIAHDHHRFRRVARIPRRLHRVRAARERAPPGPALLPQHPVLSGEPDSRVLIRLTERVPLPEQHLPAGGARLQPASHRPADVTTGGCERPLGAT